MSRCRPGIGFGEYGEGFVRIALVENRQRLRQATRNIKAFLSGRNDIAELRRASDDFAASRAAGLSARIGTFDRLRI